MLSRTRADVTTLLRCGFLILRAVVVDAAEHLMERLGQVVEITQVRSHSSSCPSEKILLVIFWTNPRNRSVRVGQPVPQPHRSAIIRIADSAS